MLNTVLEADMTTDGELTVVERNRWQELPCRFPVATLIGLDLEGLWMDQVFDE